ncbi:MAG: hypothetical protein IPL83_01565 [Bdellovibrionales bacterium]|nr:hypothetical protein [Bdellovibrionales bacterium]
MKGWLLKKLIFLFGLIVLFPFIGQAETLTSAEILTQLKDIKRGNLMQMSFAQKKVRKILGLQSIPSPIPHLESPDPTITLGSTTDLKQTELELLLLIDKQSETQLRLDFFDRLSFQIESKLKDQDLRSFLIQILNEMSSSEALSADGNTNLSIFLGYLSKAMQSVPEPNENLINFIEIYVEVSTISHPIPPEQFVNLRHYSNGKISLTAKPIAADAVGDVTEEQIDLIELENSVDQAFGQAKVGEIHEPSKKQMNLDLRPLDRIGIYQTPLSTDDKK